MGSAGIGVSRVGELESGLLVVASLFLAPVVSFAINGRPKRSRIRRRRSSLSLGKLAPRNRFPFSGLPMGQRGRREKEGEWY